MWAYIDESGNTGNQIFDENQPLFITAAMVTRINFDLVYGPEVRNIAQKVGQTALHANELGVARIEEIADDLLKLIKRADARFFVSRLEKRYLAAAKIFDTFFDAGENLAVTWHVYWLKPLRLSLMFKLCQYVVTEEIERDVWDCVTASSEVKSKAAFLRAAEGLKARAERLPDARSRQIVSEAIAWALANPENFGTHIRDKVNRYGHSPNFVAFTTLMDGLESISKAAKRPIREIVHDEQSQFKNTLAHWHQVFSSEKVAEHQPLKWPGEKEPYSLAKATGSKFRMTTEEHSPGLQVIDTILWLFKRTVSNKEIGPRGGRLLNRVFQKGQQNDMSFLGVRQTVEESLDEIMTAPIDDAAGQFSREMLQVNEERRTKAMFEYELAKKSGTTA